MVLAGIVIPTQEKRWASEMSPDLPRLMQNRLEDLSDSNDHALPMCQVVRCRKERQPSLHELFGDPILQRLHWRFLEEKKYVQIWVGFPMSFEIGENVFPSTKQTLNLFHELMD